jgi:hypothetical protein
MLSGFSLEDDDDDDDDGGIWKETFRVHVHPFDFFCLFCAL